MNGYFDLKMALAPVWQGDIIRNESLLFTPDPVTGETRPCRLLCAPETILRVCSADLRTEYLPDVDYRVENGCIVRLPEGRLPFFSYDEYFLPQPAEIPIASGSCPGRFVRYDPSGAAYLDNYKAIWDLYTADSATTGAALLTATGDQAEAEFGEGKAVFYQNGTWEFSNLTAADKFAMNPDDLAMIPIYCGVDGEDKAGLCCGTENCWAVNKNASEEDIKATLDFMNWVVTSDAGTTMLAEQFGPCPFKNAKTPENVFFAQANEYVANGNYTVTWAFNWTPAVDDWRAAVVDALSKYTTGNGSWDDVKTAFVEGWATQYANEH